jgi:hypothetical protein
MLETSVEGMGRIHLPPVGERVKTRDRAAVRRADRGQCRGRWWQDQRTVADAAHVRHCAGPIRRLAVDAYTLTFTATHAAGHTSTARCACGR